MAKLSKTAHPTRQGDAILTQSLPKEPRGIFKHMRYAGLVVLALGVILANVIIFEQIDTQLKLSKDAKVEVAVWELSQLEIDLLRYSAALRGAASAPNGRAQLAALRAGFDKIQERVRLITQNDALAKLAFQRSDAWLDLQRSDGFLAQLNTALSATTPQSFSQDVTRLSALVHSEFTRLHREMEAAAEHAQKLVAKERDDFRASLQVFAATALGLLAVKSALIIFIYLQSRLRETQRQELLQAVYNLRTTVDSSLDAAVIFDHEDRVIGCNRAGAAMFDWQESDLIVRYFGDVVRGPLGLEEIAHACAQADDGAQGRITVTAHHPKGEKYPMEISVARARSAAGMPISIAFMRDISALIEREESLRQARNAALEGQESKSRFLAMMGHELRTPLSSLLSAAELLNSDAALTEKQRELVAVMVGAGRTTLDQVNNILDITGLGTLNAQNAPVSDFDLRTLLESAAAPFEAAAKERGTEIALHISGITPPPRVSGKRALALRVLNNLLSNAVKFTQNGTITLCVDCRDGRRAGTVALRLSVSDTGIGIAKEDHGRIFNVFETLDSSYSRAQEGSGLGLSLAKLDAEAMGGTITIASTPGFGSTFSLFLTLPRAADTGSEESQSTAQNAPTERQPAPRKAAPPPLKPQRILVVEDNKINRELLSELLRIRGHHVECAAHGAEGVQRAQEQHYDAILMDISMPVMDGLEATRRIRAGDGPSRSAPIIAVTAHADPSREDSFHEAGITQVVAKPVDIDVLHRALETVLRAPSTEYKAQEGAPAPETPKHAPEPELIDDAVLSDLETALGIEYTAKMAQRFAAEAAATLTEIDACAQRNDCHAAAAAAHKNAGSAAALGLTALHHLLVAFEQAANRGDLEQAAQLRARIEQVKGQSIAALETRAPESYRAAP